MVGVAAINSPEGVEFKSVDVYLHQNPSYAMAIIMTRYYTLDGRKLVYDHNTHLVLGTFPLNNSRALVVRRRASKMLQNEGIESKMPIFIHK